MQSDSIRWGHKENGMRYEEMGDGRYEFVTGREGWDEGGTRRLNTAFFIANQSRGRICKRCPSFLFPLPPCYALIAAFPDRCRATVPTSRPITNGPPVSRFRFCWRQVSQLFLLFPSIFPLFFLCVCVPHGVFGRAKKKGAGAARSASAVRVQKVDSPRC